MYLKIILNTFKGSKTLPAPGCQRHEHALQQRCNADPFIGREAYICVPVALWYLCNPMNMLHQRATSCLTLAET